MSKIRKCQMCEQKKNTTKTKNYYYCEDCEESIVEEYDDGFLVRVEQIKAKPAIKETTTYADYDKEEPAAMTFIRMGTSFLIGAGVASLVAVLI